MNETDIMKTYGYDNDVINVINTFKNDIPIIPNGMTEYQIKQFVFNIEEFPTWYSVYYQAVLEAYSRFTAISDTLRTIKLKEKRIDLMKAIAENMESDIDGSEWMKPAETKVIKARVELKKQQIVNAIEEKETMIYSLTSRVREMMIFNDIVEMSKNKLNDDIPEWGNNKEEKKKWIVKFILKNHKPINSLIAGDMNDSYPQELSGLNKDEGENVKKVLNRMPKIKR